MLSSILMTDAPRRLPVEGISSELKRKHSDTRQSTSHLAVLMSDISELQDRVRGVPLCTLRDYIISSLSKPASEDTGSVLRFFASLQIPERLHCARCHMSYYEEENTRTSCKMEHDEEPEDDDYGPFEAQFMCCGEYVEQVSSLLRLRCFRTRTGPNLVCRADVPMTNLNNRKAGALRVAIPLTGKRLRIAGMLRKGSCVVMGSNLVKKIDAPEQFRTPLSSSRFLVAFPG